MTEPTHAAARTYRFSPLDWSGWMLGLGPAQCIALGGGLFSAGTLLQAQAPSAVVLVPVGVALLFAFASWNGRALHEWAPVMVRYVVLRASGRHRWFAPIPLLSGAPTAHRRPMPLPPFLAGLELVDGGSLSWCPATSHGGLGLVRDRRDRTLSAAVRVHGRTFALIERAEQERVVAHWGEALAAFCTERGQVCRVRVTEWAAGAGVEEHERFVAEHGADPASSEARRSYDELLRDAGPLAVGHDVLVTATVDPRRVRVRRDQRPDDACVQVLGEELRLLTNRLEATGCHVEPPLSTRQLAEAFRLRLDPACRSRLARGPATLAELAGLVSPENHGPLATETRWASLRADGSWHRTYWVAEWPRLEVGPNWLEPLLLHAGQPRSFALHYEPVPPSRSQRRVDRDSTRLAADEEQRARTGFRIGARHRRAQAAVLDRESELVAGYSELEFAGFLTVTAPDEETLLRSCGEYEQAAAQSGLELRALEGRHDLGFVCSLPVGRGLARRRFA